MNQKSVRAQLEAWAEPEYKQFSGSLLPNVPKGRLIGVRLPRLRNMARMIGKEDWRNYLRNESSDESFEEIMLQGMVIGCARMDTAEAIEWTKWFLPKIDNWSVCDSFCSGLKIAEKARESFWELIRPLFCSEKEYEVRFAAVMFLNYYIDSSYLKEGFSCLDRIGSGAYYAKMAAAWAVSVCFTAYPEETTVYLKSCSLDAETWHKSLQKILESQKVDQKTKKEIREWKKRGIK